MDLPIAGAAAKTTAKTATTATTATTEETASSLSSSPPSSPLSSFSRTPSPPPPSLPFDLSRRYPSPSATSQSGSSSPRKALGCNASTIESRGSIHCRRGDSPPPAKRRRVQAPRPRMTRFVDLENPTPESDEELGFLIQALRKKKKIVVIAGAGISVSAGIPDFRSSTGLFTTLRGQHGLRGSGKHLFDASVYKHDASTSSFHTMVRELAHMTQKARPTPFHHMLASIAHEGRLMRLYSQNIDCIDTGLAPLSTNVPLNAKGPWPVTVQLHGGLQKMVCSKCGQLEDFDGSRFEGPEPPPCQQCVELDAVRTSVAGKRSHGIGRLRPRIVLYNEYNPDEEAIGNVSKADLRRGADAVIVVGTSLKIPGVRRLVKELCQVTRSKRDGLTAWINVDNEPQSAEFKDCWDTIVRGSSDDIALLARIPHWDDQQLLDIGSPSNWLVSGKEERTGGDKLEVLLEQPPQLDLSQSSGPSEDQKIKQEDEAASETAKAAEPTLESQKSQTSQEPRSSPTTSMPTPIPSPKPARRRLPEARRVSGLQKQTKPKQIKQQKQTKQESQQSKLPFQQVPKAEAAVISQVDKAKHKVDTADIKVDAKSAAQKTQRQTKRKAKQEPKSRATDLSMAFRATKTVADSGTSAAKKQRKPLPTGKGTSPLGSSGKGKTMKKLVKDPESPVTLLSDVSDISDFSHLSSPPDSIKRELLHQQKLETGRANIVRLPSLYDKTGPATPSLLRLREPCTPPPGSPSADQTAAATISPGSKPKGMGQLID